MKKTANYLTRTLFMAATMVTTPAAAQYMNDAAMYDVNAQQNTLRLPTGNPNGADIVDNSVPTTAQTTPQMMAGTDTSYPDTNMSTTSATGVRFISGGISEEGRDGFIAMHKGEGYNTELLFTGPNGNYLANVEVHITDRKGAEVLATSTEGPLLLAALPAGTYSVRAIYDGVERKSRVTAGTKGTARAAFRFPNGD